MTEDSIDCRTSDEKLNHTWPTLGEHDLDRNARRIEKKVHPKMRASQMPEQAADVLTKHRAI